jgi:hypothetical protein
VDLDGDGYMDIISGSWPGELFFFKGGPGGTFAAPVKLKDKNGRTINIGGGRRDNGDMILVAGDATFENNGKGNVIIYDGERIEVPEGKQAGITGTASAVHAVDWNGDGVLDLLVGDIGGNVWFVPNEGTKVKCAFGQPKQLEAGGKPIRVPHGDAGPFTADWVGDGKIDLLVGAGDGSVWFYRNIGTNQEPKLAEGVMLVGPGAAEYGPNAPKEARRGVRAKICAVDWNGDGRLDLLVGDFATQAPDLPPSTPEEKAKHDKLRKELETVMARYRELINKVYGPTREKNKEEFEKAQTEFQEVANKMQSLREQLPAEYENHGWVWLFLRKPAETKSEAR